MYQAFTMNKALCEHFIQIVSFGFHEVALFLLLSFYI